MNQLEHDPDNLVFSFIVHAVLKWPKLVCNGFRWAFKKEKNIIDSVVAATGQLMITLTLILIALVG